MVERGGAGRPRGWYLALPVGLGLALASLVAFVGTEGMGSQRMGEGEVGGGGLSLGERAMRWSPADVRVQKPGLSVHEARVMLAMNQQRRWASLFGHGKGERRMPPDVALAAVSLSGKARLGKALKRVSDLTSSHVGGGARLQQLEANGSPSAKGWRNEEGDFTNESSEDEPVDMPSRQVYEYIAKPHGGRMSVEEGAREWKMLQRHYREQQPSMSTYPAVPVVFGDDDSGGHPVNVDPIDEEYGGSRRAERGGTSLRGGGPVELMSAGGMFPSSTPEVALEGVDAATSGVQASRNKAAVHAEARIKVLAKAMGSLPSRSGTTDKAVDGHVGGGGRKRVESMTEVHRMELQTLSKLEKVGGSKAAPSAGGKDVKVPKAVVDKATKMIKAAVVEQLAQKDEEEEAGEADYILGGGATREAQPGSMSALHKAVSEMLSDVGVGDEEGAQDKAVKAKLTAREVAMSKAKDNKWAKEAAAREGKLEGKLKGAAEGVTSEQKVEAGHMAKVKARALALVHAFVSAGL